MVTAALASGLRDDFGFALVELGVQHDVLDAFLLQQLGKPLRFFYRSSTDQHRLALDCKLLDLVGGREIFLLLGAVDDVGILDAQHLLVGRNHHDFQLVDLVELGRLLFPPYRSCPPAS